mmetsp:Transcript_12475/g.41084  ORF Transcript_12475/g.41084 Transcript_12475/m.41084 type:complete len:358 (-) Transcript_12475:2033-3106(-)
MGSTSSLSVSRTLTRTRPLVGIFWPAAICALAYAPSNVASMPITSPVERISGPRSVSAPGNLSNGSTASLTATCGSVTSSVNPICSSVWPTIASDAYLASGWPIALDTKGTVRLARGLASMMYTSSSRTAYWMLRRPTTLSSCASFLVHSRIVAIAESESVCGGSEHALSPECTPACSMCSMIPPITTLPSSSASASTSTSVALFRYLSTNTGCSGSTCTAVVMYRSRSCELYTISIARPPSTYDGRTITGYPSFPATSCASSALRAMPPGGCWIPSLFKHASNRSRSSAASIASGEVPRMRTLPFPDAAGIGLASKSVCSGFASLSGVCPPNCTMIPSGRSFSSTFITSSTVSGSK